MAGFFGLFDFEKEGPGIEKNAPKKRAIVVFFETFFSNFWKFLPISLLYNFVALPILTSGLANAGMTHVARNTARDSHSFGVSDFFETMGKNWKQALPAGIINSIIYAVLFFDAYFFYHDSGKLAGAGFGIILSIIFIFTVMNYYIWTLMITFKFSLWQIYKNSFKFVFMNIFKNILCFFIIALCLALYIGVLWLFSKYFLFVLILEMFIFLFTFPSFKFLLIQYFTFPAIKKYIIDPYYAEHPDEDIEKRRRLGLEIPGEDDGEFDGEDGE